MDQFIIDVLEWTCQLEDSSWRLVSSQGFPSVDNLMDIRSATALQSMEIASDTILSGKAKVMVDGGFDDLGEEGSYEFGTMKFVIFFKIVTNCVQCLTHPRHPGEERLRLRVIGCVFLGAYSAIFSINVPGTIRLQSHWSHRCN